MGEIIYLQAQAVGDPIEELRYIWFYGVRTIDSQTYFPSVYVKADNTLVVNASKMTAEELKQWTGMYFVDIYNSVETVRLNATILMPGEQKGELIDYCVS